MKKLILTGAAVTVLVSGLSTAPAMADPGVGGLRDQGSASSGTSLPSSPNGPPGPGSGVDVTSKEIGDASQESSISKLPAPPAGENVPAPSEPVNPQTTLATPAAEGTTSDAINDVATGEMESSPHLEGGSSKDPLEGGSSDVSEAATQDELTEGISVPGDVSMPGKVMTHENEWRIDKSNRAEELLDLPEVVRLVSGSPRESIFTSGIGLEDDTGGDTDSDLDSDSISPTSSIGKILGALGIGLEDEGPGG